MSGVARSSALASRNDPSRRTCRWRRRQGGGRVRRAGVKLDLNRQQRETARVSLTCYGVEALEAIVPSLKGCLADALPSLHRAGAAAAPSQGGLPAAARARRRRDALGENRLAAQPPRK